eukprot:1149690-Pelagomonas_calceolata.AAC.1
MGLPESWYRFTDDRLSMPGKPGAALSNNLNSKLTLLSLVFLAYFLAYWKAILITLFGGSTRMLFKSSGFAVCWLVRTSHRLISRTVWLKVSLCNLIKSIAM